MANSCVLLIGIYCLIFKVSLSHQSENNPSVLFPYNETDLVPISNDQSVHQVRLYFRVPFFGSGYTSLWIHRDGAVIPDFRPKTFDYQIHSLSPKNFPPLIAPLLANQNISSSNGSGVYVRIVDISKLPSGHPILEGLKKHFREGMIGANDFNPKYVVIVTWKNLIADVYKTHIASEENTYQLLLATDEKRTYAVFNYDQLSWSPAMLRNLDKVYPFVGFISAERSHLYEHLPFSQSSYLNNLTKFGYGNGLKGRYFFQINEKITVGSCIPDFHEINWRSRPKLSVFPNYGNMLGGTAVNITGPCFPNMFSKIICKFGWQETKVIWQSTNHVTCISPMMFYHGNVDLTVSIDDGPFLFAADYYVFPPDLIKSDITVENQQDQLENPSKLTINWNHAKLSANLADAVTISVWGYRPDASKFPHLTYIDVLAKGVRSVSSSHTLNLEEYGRRFNWNTYNMHIGFIAINLTYSEMDLFSPYNQSMVLWSKPMPLSWYFYPQWTKEFGSNITNEFCEDWYLREKYEETFTKNLEECPCTLEQAKFDIGRFVPSLHCNEMERRCEMFHRAAYHCVKTTRASVSGAGQMCCYDDAGELLRTGDTMYAGRPSRSLSFGKHPYLTKYLPTLSYWHNDVAPFLFCCKWAEGGDDAESCMKYKVYRKSQDCTNYRPPGVASVFGDPHFLTFDGANYTFNGKGEFLLTKGNLLNVQGRFEEVSDNLNNKRNATVLTAVAASYNSSSVVEFRMRRFDSWQYQLYLIVNNEYYSFPPDTTVMNFKGVTVYQPVNIFNMSHLIAMFDSGVGVEVKVGRRMELHVYLPPRKFMWNIVGLLGNWTGKKDDMFLFPNNETFQRPDSDAKSIHEFGKRWRLTEAIQENLGRSLFNHDSLPFADYDDKDFMPILEIRDNLQDEEEISKICGNSAACKFDFSVTKDKQLSYETSKQDHGAEMLFAASQKEVLRCPELPRPRNGRKSNVRYYVGTVVEFFCNDGYNLVGNETRTCQENGQWSRGTEAKCNRA